MANFVHVLALLLWIAAFLAFVGGLPQLAWAIIAVVVVNGAFSFIQSYRARRLLEALQEQTALTARARRDGVVVPVDARALVPGDVILLSEGDRVPADARILSSAGLEVDQSSLTGESVPVPKGTRPPPPEREIPELSNVIFAGTLVARGDAEALVFATGPDTQFGTIALMTGAQQETPGPLEHEIEALARTTATVAVVVGLIIWGVSTGILHREVSEGFVFAVGVIVALVPEGLLPTLSLSLAIGVQRMARRNALVRRLSSVEALGATQVICSDKTGTLTRNEMTVQHLWLPGSVYDITGVGYEPAGELVLREGADNREGTAALLAAATLASNASVSRDEDGRWVASGDPTEAAILVAARKAGVAPAAERLAEFPFDPDRRLMSTVDRVAGAAVLHVKGAPDSVLERCSRAPGGIPLAAAVREEALGRADRYAAAGMRVLAVASRPAAEWGEDRDRAEQDLQFLGFLAIMDPVRPEAVQAIERCHRAGVRVMIVTGDHPATAAAVAQQAGVTRGRPHVLLGHELERMAPDALQAALRREAVVARATPLHKLTVVMALQEMGQVVAAVGDGVNDAPLLRRADVGVAMGRVGTDVAREAADIILLDDNFATIVDAIEEGRAIFANIRKFVTYVFTSNVAELAPFVAFVLAGVPLPLKVLQILAVDLGTDLLPALGLGAEPPEPGTLDHLPRRRGTRLLDRAAFLRTFLLLGPAEAALGLAGYLFVYWMHGWRPGDPMADSGFVYVQATTMTFSAIVIGQIGNAFACRSQTLSVLHLPFFSNRLLLLGIGTEVLILLLLIYTPPLAAVFDFTGLGWREWAFLALLSPVLPFADEVRKGVSQKPHPTHPHRAGT